jgi:TolB-like protein
LRNSSEIALKSSDTGIEPRGRIVSDLFESSGRDPRPANGQVRWPGFVVDGVRGELRDEAGARVDLRPRSFEVLSCLAARAGRVVTKDELMAEVWPGLCVTDDSLTQCISDIRKAIGDAGHEVIRTMPRRGYMFAAIDAPALPRDSEQDATPAGRCKMPNCPALAVLAFDNFSSERDDDLLGDGLAEDITTELARNKELTVLARNTSFSVKGQGKTAREIAEAFDVRYLLEGSVRRAGDRLIVNAQLIDGRDSRHVWAERYEFGASDIYRSLADLCSKIAGTLVAEMRHTEQAASLRRPPANLDVYELTLRGIAHKHQFTKEAYAMARAELARAVALDPDYAPARIYLGFVEIIDVGMSISGTADPAGMPGAIADVRRGIDLDPSLAVGYQALSLALGFIGQFDEQLRMAERSVALGPGDAENRAFLSYALSNVCRYAEALAAINRAIALNPHTPVYYLAFHAVALYALDRFDEAARSQTLCADIQPGFPASYTIGAASEVALGKKHAAAERIASLLRFHPGITTSTPFLANMYPSDPAMRARALDHLREAGLPAGSP